MTLAAIVGCAPAATGTSGWQPAARVTEVWKAALDAYFGDEHPRGSLLLAPMIGGFGHSILPLDSTEQAMLKVQRMPVAMHVAWLTANIDSIDLVQPPSIPGYRFRLTRRGQ